MQQTVGIEGVIDACALAEGETHIQTAFAEVGLRLGYLLRRAPIFLCDVLDEVFTFLAHLRIQFEGMHDPFGIDGIAQS